MTSSNALGLDWTVEHSVEAIEDEWRAFEKVGARTPFQTFGWMRAVQNSKRGQSHCRPAFVIGRENGNIRIILPLSVTTGWFGRALRWNGDSWNDYNFPLIDPSFLRTLDVEGVDALWRAVRPLVGDIKASVLRRQPALIDGHPNPFAQWAAIRESTGAYARRLEGAWDNLYENIYSAGMRRRFKERQRKLEKSGRFFCGRVTQPSEIAHHMESMLAWKSDQVDARGARNVFADRTDRKFLIEFAVDNPDLSRVYSITLDDEPIAVAFTLDMPDSLLIYQTAYLEGPHTRRSPGRLLINYVMQAALEDGKHVLDFSVGDVGFKKEICDTGLQLVTSVSAHSLSGYPTVARERLLMAIKAALKSNPDVLAALMRLRARFKGLVHPRSISKAAADNAVEQPAAGAPHRL